MRHGAVAALALAAAAAAQEAAGPEPTLPAAVVAELSRVRTDPHGFAATLRDYRAWIGRDGIVRLPGLPQGIQLSEGTRAVDEAIAVLAAHTPVAPLTGDARLAAAAADLAADQARSGGFGHVASDGATLADRIARRGRWRGQIAETIGYGYADATLVAIQLVVDDGVALRGHRAIILDPGLTFAGAGCAPHPRWDHTCVVDWSSAAVRPPG